MSRRHSWAAIVVLLLSTFLLPAGAAAQVPGLTAPEASPEATVSQTVGLTELAVSYHRPAANGRAVWGALVPYGQVWRAGANENTTVSFSTPVTVNGTALAAGTYGLHMIPAAGDWTVIFSRETGAWGSFSYDQKEDAARVTAKPEAAPHQERLGFSFDDPTADSTVLAMRWEKLRVPLAIRIDLGRTVLESYKAQLRGLPRFGWQGWNQAANWAAQNGIELDDAMVWADRSIGMNRNFANLRTKALVLTKKGDPAAADALTKEALSIATEAEINAYGYQLLGQQKVDEAIAMFEKNVKDHPGSWNAYDSLGEAYGVKGDRKKALENYTRAMNLTTVDIQKTRIAGVIEQLKQQ
jgi:tetratricopeptide (TPR) repeat protein